VNAGNELLSFVARIAVGLLCLMPLRWAAHVGRRCGSMMYYLDARHRRVARRNLSLCFSGSKDPVEVAEIARENFRRIGENICCAVKSTALDEKAINAMLEVAQPRTPQALDALRARNILLASGHFGSFELFSRFTAHFRQFRHATTYRGIRQPALEDLLCKLRGKFGMQLFERRRHADTLKKELSAGGVMLTLFCDQSDRQHGLELPFLGRPAFTNRAPAVMAVRYDCALFAPICYRVGLGRYRIELGEPIPTTNPDGTRRSCEAITRDINTAHEAAILRDPANWFWVHNRWKAKQA
jgi:lauroyl/myristoyl acyltransferase